MKHTLRKLLTFIKSKKSILKLIFMTTVLVLVVVEFITISRRLNHDELAQILTMTKPWAVILLICLGLLSILPMIGYDFVLNHLLNGVKTKRYIFETSWMINTLNNLLGFGGIMSLGLRAQFYGQDKKDKETLYAISKILIFSMAGLSAFSLFVLITIFSGHSDGFLNQYWPCLLGGAVYFPVVFLVTRIKKEGLLGGLCTRDRVTLFLISLLEWTGMAATFIVAGKVMGVHLHITQILTVFIASLVISIVSLIPGGLGSFDVMVVLGLANLGIKSEVIVAWLLLYRIAYYFIPFILGLLLFARHLCARFNKKFNDTPKHLMQEMLHKILTWMMYCAGIVMVLSATVPAVFTRLTWLHKINPWSKHLISDSPKLVLGFLLIIGARAVANRVKRAHIPVTLLLIAALLYLISFGYNSFIIIYMAIMLILTWYDKPELFREQLVTSYESALKDGIAIFVLALLYIVVGVYNLPLIRLHSTWVNSFLIFPSESMWLIGFVAVIVVCALMLLFTKYLRGDKKEVGMQFDADAEARVLAILKQYGGNEHSHLVFLKDKRVFIYSNSDGIDTVFLQFASYDDKLLVMGSPSGSRVDFVPALKAFVEQADRLGYAPIFYEVTEDLAMELHALGFSFFKMGEEGQVDLRQFSLSGKKYHSIRIKSNRISREGYRIEILEEPPDDNVISRLRQISDEWLRDRRERGFSMGFFSEEYIVRTPIAAVKNSEDVIIAFATLMPSYTDKLISVDLMRYGDDAPRGVMDYLFTYLFAYCQNQGYEYFDMGMAPLSNVGLDRRAVISERIANLIYQYGTRIYSFQGLRAYKSKFVTHWVSRYTLYRRDSLVPFVIWALLAVDKRDPKKSCDE